MLLTEKSRSRLVVIKNREKFEEFEHEIAKSENLPYKKRLAVYDSVLKKALAVGVFSDEIMEGSLEAKIRLAKALNSLK